MIIMNKTIQNFTQQIEMLKFDQSNRSENLQTLLQDIKNRTTNLEKDAEDNRQQFNEITTQQEKNELNKTLVTLQKNIIDNVSEIYDNNKKLQKQQDLMYSNVTNLKNAQNKSATKLEALQAIHNRTKEETNKLNQSLTTLQKTIIDNITENHKHNMKQLEQHKIRINSEIEKLKNTQNKSTTNFKVLQGIYNRTKEETIKLNKTLITVKKSITAVKNEQIKELRELQKEYKNFIDLLHQTPSLAINGNYL